MTRSGAARGLCKICPIRRMNTNRHHLVSESNDFVSALGSQHRLPKFGEKKQFTRKCVREILRHYVAWLNQFRIEAHSEPGE